MTGNCDRRPVWRRSGGSTANLPELHRQETPRKDSASAIMNTATGASSRTSTAGIGIDAQRQCNHKPAPHTILWPHADTPCPRITRSACQDHTGNINCNLPSVDRPDPMLNRSMRIKKLILRRPNSPYGMQILGPSANQSQRLPRRQG